LKKLRNCKNQDVIQNEIEELRQEMEAQTNQVLVPFKYLLLKKELRRPLIAAIVIQISQVKYFQFFSVNLLLTFIQTNMHFSYASAVQWSTNGKR
jgi:hypothetical protein